MNYLLLLVFLSKSPRVASKYDSLDLFSPSFTKNISKNEMNAAMLLRHIDYSLEKAGKKEGHIAQILTSEPTNKYHLFRPLY